ncbi:MAG: hypothetical protein Q9184_005710 [Pyrenodesmia sp. 2 TL-2023]
MSTLNKAALPRQNAVYIIRPTNFVYRLFDMWHPEMFRIGSGMLAAYREQFQRWSIESHAIRQLLQFLEKRAVVPRDCSGAESAKAVWQQEVKKTYNKHEVTFDNPNSKVRG